MARKGQYQENRVTNAIEETDYIVETPTWQRYDNKDFWNRFDYMATHENGPIRFGQVKTGTARGINEFTEWVQENMPVESDDIIVEFIVYINKEGLRQVIIDENGYHDGYDERDDDYNMTEGFKNHLQEQLKEND